MATDAKLIRMNYQPPKDQGQFPLRTKETIGFYDDPPVPGQSFRFFSESLSEPGGARIIQTSPVKSVVKHGDVVEFRTENSAYRLEILPKA